MEIIISFIQRAILQGTPLLFGATGEILTEKSGNLNLGIPGIMYIGAICGLAGLLLVGGSSHSIDSNLVDGRGFTAIMVSWLAKFDPFTMILTTLLLVFLARGADEVTSKFGLNSDFSEILTGIILFFIIGCEFFINYKISLRKTGGKEEK